MTELREGRLPGPSVFDASEATMPRESGAPARPAEPFGSFEPNRCDEVLAGRYRLLRRIGGGGMATVYLAEHVEIHKRLAVKVLATKLALDASIRERFLREAKAASKVAHDNVVEIVDYGATDDGSVFLVMELLDGEDLGETVAREAPFSTLRVKRIGLQICRALHAAHTKGVIHRDIKPDNCLRIRRGANRDFIKVIDFGLAKTVGDEANPERSLTQTGMVFGTPEYMSPEQCHGKRVDPRSDVYSVGVMLYEFVTGHVPFVADSAIAVLAQQTLDPPPPPSQIAGVAVQPELEAIIMRCLEKERDDRFETIKELAEAIIACPDGPAASAKSGASGHALSAGSEPALSATTLRLLIGLQAATLLVALVALVVLLTGAGG